MSKARQCKVGDKVTTDWDSRRSGITEHIIVAKGSARSQSGIVFQVEPPLRLAGPDAWIDADWFEPSK